MALLPVFPFVPVAPGVPPLLRAAADVQAPALLASAVATGVTSPLLGSMLSGSVPSMLNGYGASPLAQLSGALNPPALVSQDIPIGLPSSGSRSPTPQWGIFDDSGKLVIKPDSIWSFDFAGDHEILNYPIESGSFQSYNKVQIPFEARVVMRKGGTLSDRQTFLNTLNQIRGDLKLYTVATPELSYTSVNIYHVDYTRRAEDGGASMIEATVSLKQINVTASTQFTNTAAPQSQDAFNGGTVDAKTPTASQMASVPPPPPPGPPPGPPPTGNIGPR